MTVSAIARFKCDICGKTQEVASGTLKEVGIAHQYEAGFDSPRGWYPFRTLDGKRITHACRECVVGILASAEAEVRSAEEGAE